MEKKLLEDIIQWDVANWGKAIPFWTPHLKALKGKKAASFGEREGGLTLWLTQQGFSVECSDYNLPETIPFELHERYGVTDQVNYSKQDITSIQFEDNQFDVVVFKSVIGTLNSKERQQKALDELHRILKPGGYLLFAENLEATGFHRFARKKFTSWGHRWRYLKWNEMPEMLSKFNQVSRTSCGFFATFGRTEKQRRILAGFDRVFVPIVPKSWRYVLIAACRK